MYTSNTLDLYIYRHAHSCSNVYKTKVHNYLSTRMYKKKRDPSLSVYGIATTLHSRSNKPPINPVEQIVYVSCLVRTWQTAFLKYFGFTKHLHLVVSPFLKEKYSFAFEISNTQESLNASFQKMRDLFQYCKNLKLFEKPFSKTDVTVSLFHPTAHEFLVNFRYSADIAYIQTENTEEPEFPYYEHMLTNASRNVRKQLDITANTTQPSELQKNNLMIGSNTKRGENKMRLYKWNNKDRYDEILRGAYDANELKHYVHNDTTDSLIKFIAHVLWKQTSGKIIIVTHNHIMKEFMKKAEIAKEEIKAISKFNLWMLNLTVLTAVTWTAVKAPTGTVPDVTEPDATKLDATNVALDVHTNYYQTGYAVIPLNEFDERREYLCLLNRRWLDYPRLGGTRKKKKTRRH